MARSERDVVASHIADPTTTEALTGVDTGTDMTSAQAAGLIADLDSLNTAVNAILVALENHGIVAKS